MTAETERLRILDDLEHGRISADEGRRLLQALEAIPAPENSPESEPNWISTHMEEEGKGAQSGPAKRSGYSDLPLPSDMQRWQSLWRLPFWTGVFLTVTGALLLYQALRGPGFGLLFFIAGFPFALGVALMAIGWWARTARWLHLRIRQRPGRSPENLAISFPLPLGLAARVVQRYAGRLPPVGGMPLSEMIRSLEKNTTPDRPFYMQAEDDRTGEKVRIYIG